MALPSGGVLLPLHLPLLGGGGPPRRPGPPEVIQGPEAGVVHAVRAGPGLEEEADDLLVALEAGVVQGHHLPEVAAVLIRLGLQQEGDDVGVAQPGGQVQRRHAGDVAEHEVAAGVHELGRHRRVAALHGEVQSRLVSGRQRVGVGDVGQEEGHDVGGAQYGGDVQRGLAEERHEVGVGAVLQEQLHQLVADEAHVEGRHRHDGLAAALGVGAVPPRGDGGDLVARVGQGERAAELVVQVVGRGRGRPARSAASRVPGLGRRGEEHRVRRRVGEVYPVSGNAVPRLLFGAGVRASCSRLGPRGSRP